MGKWGNGERPREASAFRGHLSSFPRSRTPSSSRPLREPVPFLVPELAAHEHDHVDQPPDAQAPEGEELEQPRADLADIEAVCTEDAQEEAEQSRRKDALFRRHLWWQRLHHAA